MRNISFYIKLSFECLSFNLNPFKIDSLRTINNKYSQTFQTFVSWIIKKTLENKNTKNFFSISFL